MARVYVSVGSNIEPAKNIRSVIAALRQLYPQLILSSVYESEAVGFDGDNFYNLVVGFDTDLEVMAVVAQLRHLEDTHARDRRGPKFSARTIDLDLLLYDDLIWDSAGLRLPREEICYNAFVLWPLAEVAGELKHQETRQSYQQMWQAFDKTTQELWPIPFEWTDA